MTFDLFDISQLSNTNPSKPPFFLSTWIIHKNGISFHKGTSGDSEMKIRIYKMMEDGGAVFYMKYLFCTLALIQLGLNLLVIFFLIWGFTPRVDLD